MKEWLNSHVMCRPYRIYYDYIKQCIHT